VKAIRKPFEMTPIRFTKFNILYHIPGNKHKNKLTVGPFTIVGMNFLNMLTNNILVDRLIKNTAESFIIIGLREI